MKKSYLVRNFREESGRLKVPESAFIPLFHIAWQMADDTLCANQFSSLSDPIFREREGHFKKGRWKCLAADDEVFITPYYTDLDVVSEGTVHMVYRIEVEGMVSGAVEMAFCTLVTFFKKYASDKALFHVLHTKGIQLMSQYRADVFSSDIRRFYNLGM